MNETNAGKSIVITAFLLILACFSSCKNDKPLEIVTIAIGLSMDPREPKMALEVEPESNHFFFFISKPLEDTCHYYSGTLGDVEIEYIKTYLLSNLIHLDTLGYKEIDDATRIEIFHLNSNGVSKRGFGHIGVDAIREDSVFKIVNFLKKSPDFGCTVFHKFNTSIQYETLPIPPSLQ